MSKYYTRLVLVTFVIFLISCATQHYSESQIRKNLSDHRQYKVIQLENDLQVVLVSDPNTVIGGATLVVGAGWYDDPEEQQGLAHYLEHMLFLGTEKYPKPGEFNTFIRSNGGQFNGTTHQQKTSYYFTVPIDAFSEGLERFSGFFSSPTFDQQYSQKELSAIENEWSLRRISEPHIRDRLWGLLVNSEHPENSFAVGNKYSLSDKPGSVLYDEMIQFYQQYYFAGNMKLVLYSNESTQNMEEQARRLFSPIPKKKKPISRKKIAAFNEYTVPQHVYFGSNTVNKWLNIYFPIKNNSETWRNKTNDYLVTLLLQNHSESLVGKLKSKFWVNDVQVALHPRAFGDEGFVLLAFNLTDLGMKNKSEIMGAVLAYIDFLKADGLVQNVYDELNQKRQQSFKGQHIQDVVPRMHQIAFNLFELPVEHVLDADRVFDTFDPDSVRSVLNQMNLDQIFIWHYGTDKDRDQEIPYFPGAFYSSEEISLDERRDWQSRKSDWQFSVGQKNPWVSANTPYLAERKHTTPTEVVREKWGEAYLMQDKDAGSSWGFSHIRIDSNAGVASPKNFILGCLVNDIFSIENEAGHRQAEEAGLKVKFGRTPHNSQFLEVHGPTTFHQEIIDNLLASFRELKLDENSFDNALMRFQRWQAGLSNNMTPLEKSTYLAQHLTLSKHWMPDQLVIESRQLTLEDLQIYHKSLLSKHYIRLFSAGNYNLQMVEDIATAARNNFPQRQSGAPAHVEYIDFSKASAIKKVVKSGHGDNAYARVYIGNEASIKTEVELRLLNAFFASGLSNFIRTDGEMAYAVNSHVTHFNRYPALIMQVQSNNTSIDDLAAQFDAYESKFRAMLVSLDDEKIHALARSMITEITAPPTELWSTVRWDYWDWQLGDYSFSSKQKHLDALESITKRGLLEKYESMVVRKKATVVEVGINGQAL